MRASPRWPPPWSATPPDPSAGSNIAQSSGYVSRPPVAARNVRFLACCDRRPAGIRWYHHGMWFWFMMSASPGGPGGGSRLADPGVPGVSDQDISDLARRESQAYPPDGEGVFAGEEILSLLHANLSRSWDVMESGRLDTWRGIHSGHWPGFAPPRPSTADVPVPRCATEPTKVSLVLRSSRALRGRRAAAVRERQVRRECLAAGRYHDRGHR